MRKIEKTNKKAQSNFTRSQATYGFQLYNQRIYFSFFFHAKENPCLINLKKKVCSDIEIYIYFKY